MDDATFKRLAQANRDHARLCAHGVAAKIDAKYGTFFRVGSQSSEEQIAQLLRLRAVALAHYVPVLRVVEIIRGKYARRETDTALGMRFNVLVSDKALAYANAQLSNAPVRRTLRKASTWTAKGLASLSDERLQGKVVHSMPGAVEYAYRGKPE